ncbi:hypothetical protein G7K_1762-t1 [Saitoella complicata NRRL Y-17804]|uniref:Histone-lysine N-methyltransferase SET5 n=2 Tax=Saitoella complicata (strain BCRC 22490 / CBS 7301 / JCM 7358 / NBRC 10748 / NRRL Y-17804) TaxID=698492 RepID=A0A0E9NCG0_SAICN|nr:hypothetical protein G7K_1762-t1 [Saitoella complicata NRRL Y-17804]
MCADAIASITPTEHELIKQVTAIRNEHGQTLGVPKLLAQVKDQKPDWAVSEKRLRKVLAQYNLGNAPPKGTALPNAAVSHLTPNFDIKDTTTKLAVKEVKGRGKGLYGTEDTKSGTSIFEEIPYVWAPPLAAVDGIRDGKFCALCARPVTGSLQASCSSCGVKYCTGLCKKRDEPHRITCTKKNPAWKKFVDLCVSEDWMGGMGVGMCWAKIAAAKNGEERDLVVKTLGSFATVKQVTRQEQNTSWMFEEEGTRALWKSAYALLTKALPPSELWTEEQFDLHLGMFNINNIAGGVYLAQSHLNHSCAPNTKIGNPLQYTNYKISVNAITDITEGEEVTITYTNPNMDKERRRDLLRKEYGFVCDCVRCVKGEEAVKEDVKKALKIEQ